MANKKCPKCGSELALHEGYGVCNSCGEIVAAAEGEETKSEVTETVIDEVAETESKLFATQIPEEYPVEEAVAYEEEIQEPEAEEPVAEERPEETFYVVEKKEKKGKKKSAVPLMVLILCALLAVGGYYVVKDMSSGDIDEIESFNEEMPPEISAETEEDEGINEEISVFDEPVTAPVGTLEDGPEIKPADETAEVPAEEAGQATKPAEKPQENPATTPAAKPTPKPAVSAPVQQPAAEKPAIAYRVRKTADDSDTQIGAFADLERAKNFAAAHAADGYKVFDMSGNLVYTP